MVFDISGSRYSITDMYVLLHFCSPLGAPASYPMYDLTTPTYCAINKALRQANKAFQKGQIDISEIRFTVDLDQYKNF